MTMPVFAAGEEPPASKMQTLSDGIMGTASGQGWTNVTFASGWVAFDASLYRGVKYRKIGAIVYVQGMCKRSSTTSTAGQTIFTLPAGFRPADRQLILFGPSGTDGTTPRRVDIGTAGTVIDAIGGMTTAHLLSLNFSFPAT